MNENKYINCINGKRKLWTLFSFIYVYWFHFTNQPCFKRLSNEQSFNLRISLDKQQFFKLCQHAHILIEKRINTLFQNSDTFEPNTVLVEMLSAFSFNRVAFLSMLMVEIYKNGRNIYLTIIQINFTKRKKSKHWILIYNIHYNII